MMKILTFILKFIEHDLKNSYFELNFELVFEKA